MTVPVMYQGGTRDFGITPLLNKSGGAYDQTPALKFYVELDGAGHFAWTDINSRYQRTITDDSIAFFDTYLKARPFPNVLLKKQPGVSVLREHTN
jgi:hypothetical protein